VTADLVLVGGGLANCLIAYRLAGERPELVVVVLERGTTLGGRHTWSFHEHDLTGAQWSWVRPLVEHSWSRHVSRADPGCSAAATTRYRRAISGRSSCP
jgi:lycopene beta-cyclase